MQTRSAIPVAAVLIPLLLAGCGGAPARAGRDYTAPGWQVATVKPNWTLDLEYSWGSGQHVSWDWATDGGRLVYFQLVRIDNGQARQLVGMHRNESADSRSTPQAGRYDYLWMNDGGLQDIVVHFNVPEGAIVHQWPPGQGPGCAPPLLARTPC